MEARFSNVPPTKNSSPKSPLYSETAYDDAFRTMEGRCDDILIPFVSHMFGEHYSKGATVRRLRNEHFVEHENGANEKRVTDSSFEIIDRDVTRLYHLECESKRYDGSILIRIFEYGSQIAKDFSETEPSRLKLSFPNTGILLLRASKTVPDKVVIELLLPNNTEASYDVPLLKVSDYTIDDIFNRQLYMLIPYYIFNYENSLSEINEMPEKLEILSKEYHSIFDRLDGELEKGNLSAASYSAIIKLTASVAYKLTSKQKNVQEKVGDIMGGKILDLPEFRIYDQGKEEGFKEGVEEGIEKGLIKGRKEGKIIARYEDGMSIEAIAKKYDISVDKIKEILQSENLI
ncbi:hypothetical protein [Butyrivibrio sp. MC2013]|uniref:hypothetical protein n=1 Tax=Butyrivibrio sp. MC2013 TaxID=1280686 RepID=UPI0006876D71|nr:hypothetical protein [Butyrivibrio sp. MC2013]